MMALGSTSALSPRRIGRCVGLQDGGASSMVGGHNYVMEIITEYVSKGLDPETLAFSRTNKSFLFGGTIAPWPTGASTFQCGSVEPRAVSSAFWLTVTCPSSSGGPC